MLIIKHVEVHRITNRKCFQIEILKIREYSSLQDLKNVI